MAALDGALALAEVHHVAVGVGQHLDLDVARRLDIALEVDGGVAEGAARLAPRRAQRARQLAGGADHAHALAAAAHGRLDHDGIAHLGRHARGLGVVGDGRLRARHHRHAQPDGGAPRRDLVAHGADGRGGRPDEDEPGGGARLGEARVLGEEAVARVHRLRAACPGPPPRSRSIAR